MAALVIIQKMANVPSSCFKVANFVAFVGAMYSFYALYSSGEEAMLYGSPRPSSAGRYIYIPGSHRVLN